MTAHRLIRSCDPIQLGKLIVEIATGQVEDQTEDGKNPAAVARGRKREEGDQSLLLHFMPYNFVRIHHSLRITPAMAAGVTTKLWSLTGHGSRDRSLRSATRDQTLGSSRWLKSMRSARADKYREEAARLRREAEDMKHSENRQQLLDIAAQYDRLADSAERTP